MRFIINMLQIKQHQIGDIQQVADLRTVIIAVGIKSRMQIPALLHFSEQLFDKMRL
ncbi:hypothetical protein D3C73_1488680 [compost metagenome]